MPAVIAWLTAIWVASVLGSVHCAAMCGPFACLAATHGGAPRLSHHWSYQAGRLGGYLLLGTLAGGAGHWLDRAGLAVGVGRVAALAMAVLLVAWGLHALVTHRGGRLGELRLPDRITRRAGAVLGALMHQPPAVRGSATGLLTALLPCGWLWVFVAAALGSGSAVSGALVMAAFWAGSVPALALVVAGAARLAGRWQPRLPLVSAGVIVLLGLTSLAIQLDLIPAAHWLHRLLPVPPHHGGQRG